jgi:hypothetical protein
MSANLIFAVYPSVEKPNYLWFYEDLLKSFQKMLDRIGKGAIEDGNELRRRRTPLLQTLC